jgi:outer membrane protein TolC
MKIVMTKKLFVLILCFITWKVVVSQNGNDISERLLPLSALMDSAALHSPMLKFYNADILINELKVKSEKRDWMRHLGVEAGVKYGLLDNVVFSSYFGANMNNFNSETRYSIGAYLRIPIGSVLDKSAVKMSEQEIVKAEQLFERTLQELRQLVIIQYNNLIKSHRSLIVRSNLVATYEAQMLRAEKDFTEGNIDVSEYARLNEMYTTSILNLEENKVEFNTALQILQETVGVKIDIND